mgnify:CR=1 FL=1
MGPHSEADRREDHTLVSERPAHASIAGSGLAIGASTAVRLATGLAIGIIVARMLGPGAKGELALLQQLPAIAALLSALGFDAAHGYFVGRHRRDAAAAVSDSVVHALIAGPVSVPALVLVMRLLVPALAEVPPATLVIAASAAPVLVLASLLGGVLTGQGRLGRQALAGGLAASASLVVVASLALSGRLTLAAVVGAGLLGAVVSAVTSLIATGARTPVRPSRSRIAERWGYARRSYVQSVTGYLELRQDIVLLGILGPAAGVGLYSVGASVAELLFYLPQVLASALTARALQEDAAEGAAITASITRLLVAALVVMAGVVAVIARPLVTGVFGAQFAPAASVVWLLLPGIVIWGVASQSGAYLASHGRLFPKVSTATLLLNLALNLALIPVLGIQGAAISTSISYAASSLYILRTFLVTTGTRTRDLVRLRRADLALAAAAVSALGSRLRRR